MKSLVRLAVCFPFACSAVIALAQPPNLAASPKSLMQQAVDRYEAKGKGTRIVGGTAATWADNRWQVALVYAKDADNARAQFCGGSIIAPGWVVTAAHCIDKKYTAGDYAVLSKTDNLKAGGQRSRITAITVHERWRHAANKSRYDNDIALLKIDPATPVGGVAVPLVAAGTELDNLSVLVTGWGVTEHRPEGTEGLKQVTVPSVSEGVCNAPKAYHGTVTNTMFCAGEHKKDACQGDSGGPATAMLNGKRHLIGVVSWGIGCGERDKYGVYTRLPLYREWIAKQTSGQVK